MTGGGGGRHDWRDGTGYTLSHSIAGDTSRTFTPVRSEGERAQRQRLRCRAPRPGSGEKLCRLGATDSRVWAGSAAVADRG